MDRCTILVATLLLAASVATAGPSDRSYGASLISGFESNPLRVQGDGPDAIFTQLQIDGYYTHQIRPSLGLLVGGQARTRLHDRATANADYIDGSFRTAFVVTPRRIPRFKLVTGVTGSLYRATFTDRASGRIYEVDAVPDISPPSTIPIGERLDYGAAGVFIDTRWNPVRSVALSLDMSVERANYVEDYGKTTALDSLNYRSWRVEPGVTWRIHRVVTVSASLSITDLDYTDQPALDKSGFAVSGVSRSYRFAQAGLRARIVPTRRWAVHLGASNAERRDTFARYYDYGALSSYVSVDRKVGRTGLLRFYGSMLDIDYDNATVTGDPLGQVRSSQVKRLLARYERDVGPALRWFVESGMRRAESRDPIYSYDSDWLLSGVRFRR